MQPGWPPVLWSLGWERQSSHGLLKLSTEQTDTNPQRSVSIGLETSPVPDRPVHGYKAKSEVCKRVPHIDLTSFITSDAAGSVRRSHEVRYGTDKELCGYLCNSEHRDSYHFPSPHLAKELFHLLAKYLIFPSWSEVKCKKCPHDKNKWQLFTPQVTRGPSLTESNGLNQGWERDGYLEHREEVMK